MKNNEKKTTITKGEDCQNLPVNETYLNVNDIYLEDCQLTNQILRSSVAHIREANEKGARALLSVAYHLAVVDKTGAYRDDNFKSTVEFAKTYFGYKNSYASALVKIGKRNMVLESGRTMFFPVAGTQDFTAKHLEVMCPLDNATLVSMVEDGTLNPSMTVKEVASAVRYRKAILNNEIIEGEAEEKETKDATNTENTDTPNDDTATDATASEKHRIAIITSINDIWGKITESAQAALILELSEILTKYTPVKDDEPIYTAESLPEEPEEPTPN